MSPSQRGDVAPRTTAGNHLRSNNHSVPWLLQPQRIDGGWPREVTKKLFAAASPKVAFAPGTLAARSSSESKSEFSGIRP